MNGRSGESARRRWAATSSSSISARRSSSESFSIFATSCEVRNPSKKWRKGTRASRVAIVEIAAMSCASCTDEEQSIAKPVVRAAITSEWSPKIESACVATVRAATWITAEVSSPASLNMSGSIRRRPCEAVKVVVSAPAWSAPCTAPAAPASLCISITRGTWPQMFGVSAADQASASSPIAEAGVIG